jgi:hypothetical protein
MSAFSSVCLWFIVAARLWKIACEQPAGEKVSLAGFNMMSYDVLSFWKRAAMSIQSLHGQARAAESAVCAALWSHMALLLRRTFDGALKTQQRHCASILGNSRP